MALHIVVIEDDPAIQDLYRFLLEAEGYHVTISYTLYEDITTVAALHPDLIILDLLIGGKQSGGQFLQLLKSSPLAATIPILIATAAVSYAQEWGEFTKTYKIPVIFKPFDIDAVLMLVKQILTNEPDAIA